MKQVTSFFVALLVTITVYAQAIKGINYEVSFPNMVHHEAKIDIHISGLMQKGAIFRMSRSSPGRYATHEFGKNVYDVKAFDRDGKSITINRIDGDVYEVPRHDGYIHVQYTLYANHPDGTYAGIDQNSIHLNMPAAFMWLKGFDKEPINIKFNLPADKKWTIATQLQPTADATLFKAPGLQYFMDSPVKIGELIMKNWTAKNTNGKEVIFRLALEAATTDSLATVFAGKVQRITQEAAMVFGELPNYDFGTYTFLASINPYVKGDGMEHRNSTMICLPLPFMVSNNLLGVFSHEFFHCWNVERIRPKTLEPFNFEKSNMSNELWCAEGFTQYYGDLLLVRAGLETEDEFMGSLAQLINSKESTPGGKNNSPAAVSRNAVFVDAGVAIDKSNYANMYSSYYPYGGAIALALDLELRTRFNLTLDDYMTGLWKRFGKTEVPYTIPGLEDVLAEVTKDKKFASSFFDNYINGHQSFDYKTLLDKAGLVLKKVGAGKPWLGRVQYKEGSAPTINSNTVIGTPLYEAGLDFEDQITQLDGKPVARSSDFEDILKDHKPGDKISIEYVHRGDKKTGTITIGENNYLAISTYEKEGLTPTADMLQFRKSWMGTKLKSQGF